MNINQILNRSLSLLTYNENQSIPPKGNIYMGIGLWSLRDGLSEGLPIDIMQMLLTASIKRAQILESNPGKPSKVILLIADSMAIREGAEKEKVARLCHVYKKSLEPLLTLLNLKEESEIILSSDLERSRQYSEALDRVEASSIVKQLKIEDEAHFAYIRTQTAVTRYMNNYRNVGIKVGWIYAASSQHLHTSASKHWDELKFDRWYNAICEDSPMEYLYARAGLKQTRQGKHINVSEGCPYTAYPKDQRYIVQTQSKKEIATTCPIQKKVASYWNGIAEICFSLIQTHVVNGALLPKNCINKRNAVAAVYNMLNHWINYPIASIPLLYTYLPTSSDAYAELTFIEEPIPQKKCILI